MADCCPDCGALYSLVGRTHRCVANKPSMANASVANRTDDAGKQTEPVRRPDKPHRRTIPAVAAEAEPEDRSRDHVAAPTTNGAYRYRDPDKRRAYMRQLMARRRADARLQ